MVDLSVPKSGTEGIKVQKGDVHRCKESEGRAQTIVLLHQLMGDQGPLVWHLQAPYISAVDGEVIFIINFCPWCGKDLNASNPVAGESVDDDAISGSSADALTVVPDPSQPARE